MLLVGVSAICTHYTLTCALKLTEASIVVKMEFLRLPAIAVVGYFFYNEVVEFWMNIGAILMCTGIIINLRSANRR